MAPQDSFIDEDDDSCPLCVEEFDLSDKNFRPCPCGYQVCQFCFNNIKNNMNGLCPACRRPYDEKTIEWKVVTPEEIAQFKANIQKNAKKKAEQRQKEAQKREVESLNRKHLSGLRVVQKNLVYVVGLQPSIREEEILQTLRGDKYFGQYGKIIKIVVSKAKQGEAGPSGPSLGVYVTFAKKEDAARCISAVNGSQNGDRVLRAQLGTTKYCSAYLRNETCTNKQCMFLHEPGDNDDSYSRQDLSSINSVNTQRPLPSMTSSTGSSSRQSQAQAPIQQAQPIAAATHPMVRDGSKDGSDSGDGSALPSAATWAKQRSRRGSLATSGDASSPAISQSMPVTAERDEEPHDSAQDNQEPENTSVVTQSVSTPSTESRRLERNPVLMHLLRAIHTPAFTHSPVISDNHDSAAFPPLFDRYGGEKRRAMRDQQEEARLHIEQESQADTRSITDPTDEEEPESGSFQLGGEPEDTGRESNFPQGHHGQRRLSSQLPIQRSANGGPFGPSLGQAFPQNLGNLSSINGRPLTTMQQQQLLLLKGGQPQSGFLDQLHQGMGQNLNLFQQQGHNRHTSRYNFANETSSASSAVKPSANPKFLAQQNSMMPGSHHQQGNQFYGSSMPGPPPGLKSSGTPINGMFGQNHNNFGGSLGGGFGGKDKSNELLRDVMRGRSAGSGQVHDAGKREFISSFLQSYPSASSTPAPSSSLQASLYGHQAGAFLDFGQKQKKKGKKHRHANTSSSGGGGLVDLADPSILQARMQHQQQSNAGVGQGLFGGQAQDDPDLPSLDEASSSVDALVADNTNDDVVFPVLDPFGFGFRSSTPSFPPGFGPTGYALPHGHPEPIVPDTPTTKPPSRIVPTSAPFTPSRATSFVPGVNSTVLGSPIPSQFALPSKAPEISTAQAKQDVKAFASSSGLSKTIASHAPQANLHFEDFPALESTKPKPTPASLTKTFPLVKASSLASTAKKQTASVSNMGIAPQPATKPGRSTAGILNIVTSSSKDASEHIAVASSSFPPLPPSTPSVATFQLPPSRQTTILTKTTKTLPTPKTETPTAGTTPSSTTSMFPPTYHASRQAGLASVSKTERSGTPTSEIISDNASITSASISRANSPPPSKVGSAPVRANTKSMQKKQRKEMQKEKEKQELEAAAAKPEPEAEIGPIMGRKKKQKKEKVASSAAGGSTPAASRPPSPCFGAESVIEEERDAEAAEEQEQAPEKQTQPEKEEIKSSQKLPDVKGKGKAKSQRPPSPEPRSAATETDEEPTEKLIPTPASVLRDLVSSGALPDPSKLSFLKPLPVNVRHQEASIDLQNPNPKLIITPEDRAALLAGKPVRKNLDGPNRYMLTPNGECLRNLTPEEEDRYLELQASIARSAGPAAFCSAKHHASSGFTLISGRAVPNGPPSCFPQSTDPMDPVSKIQRDEALSYINQYVLPSLSTNAQLEKALNANAFDAEILRSAEAAAWASWGTDHPAPKKERANRAFGSNHDREGILATGLESMTAHFAIGRDTDRGQPLGTVPMLSTAEAESALLLSRKETEVIEKKLIALMKKNKRLLLGSGH